MSSEPVAEKSLALSRILWIVGAVMWCLVFAAVAWLWTLDRPTGINSAGEEGSPAERAAGRQIAAPNGKSEQSPPVWNAEGISDFELTERSGKTVKKQDLLGKPWVAGFVFTRCAGPCPKVSGQMAKLNQELDEVDFRLVTMTVDPEYDTPDVLSRYADFFDAPADKWLFLTGDETTIHQYIADEFLMPVQRMEGEARKPGFEVLHTTNLMLVDSTGVVRGKYNAVLPEEMVKLRRDLKKLADET